MEEKNYNTEELVRTYLITFGPEFKHKLIEKLANNFKMSTEDSEKAIEALFNKNEIIFVEYKISLEDDTYKLNEDDVGIIIFPAHAKITYTEQRTKK